MSNNLKQCYVCKKQVTEKEVTNVYKELDENEILNTKVTDTYNLVHLHLAKNETFGEFDTVCICQECVNKVK